MQIQIVTGPGGCRGARAREATSPILAHDEKNDGDLAQKLPFPLPFPTRLLSFHDFLASPRFSRYLRALTPVERGIGGAEGGSGIGGCGSRQGKSSDCLEGSEKRGEKRSHRCAATRRKKLKADARTPNRSYKIPPFSLSPGLAAENRPTCLDFTLFGMAVPRNSRGSLQFVGRFRQRNLN